MMNSSGSSTMMRSSSSLNFFSPCSYCVLKGGVKCLGCSSVLYCSLKCQELDWPTHQFVCFPKYQLVQELRLHSRPPSPPYFIASRSIGAGESILKFQAIMIAPYIRNVKSSHSNDKFDNGKCELCLGCCKWFIPQVDSTYLYGICPCGAALCSESCRKESYHSQYECKILGQMEYVMHPKKVKFYYEIILLIRMILLREVNPKLWALFLQYSGYSFKPTQSTSLYKRDSTISKFILTDIKINGFLREPLTFTNLLELQGAIEGASVAGEEKIHTVFKPGPNLNSLEKSYISAKYIFPKRFLFQESCIPNVRWNIKHGSKIGEDCHLTFIAAVDILPGTPLNPCFNFCLPMGTLQRRRAHSADYGIECFCRRCKDPTELGSFLSGIKCNACTAGYLLQTNPIEETSEWRCNTPGCIGILTFADAFIKIERMYNNAGKDKSWSALWILLSSYEKALHPNHFILYRIFTNIMTIGWAMIQKSRLDDIPYKFLIHMLPVLDRVMGILDIISPGFSIDRGRNLYIKQMIMGFILLRNARAFRRESILFGTTRSRYLPLEMNDLRRVQRECFDILRLEPSGTVLHDMAYNLFDLIQDQDFILSLLHPDRAYDATTIEELARIYSRFCSEYCQIKYVNNWDWALSGFLLSTGSLSYHMLSMNR